MKKTKTIGYTGIMVVPHKERPASLEVQITGISQWKQDVFNLVAELTKYRLRNKITQQELANRLKVNQSVIARFERLGRYPTIEFLYKVAAGLGIQFDLSLKEAEKPSEEAGTKDNCTSEHHYYQILNYYQSGNPSLKCIKPLNVNVNAWDVYPAPFKIGFIDKEMVLTSGHIRLIENKYINPGSISPLKYGIVKPYISIAWEDNSKDIKKHTNNVDTNSELAA